MKVFEHLKLFYLIPLRNVLKPLDYVEVLANKKHFA